MQQIGQCDPVPLELLLCLSVAFQMTLALHLRSVPVYLYVLGLIERCGSLGLMDTRLPFFCDILSVFIVLVCHYTRTQRRLFEAGTERRGEANMLGEEQKSGLRKLELKELLV